MPMGRLVYMVLFTPLTSYALPFSLLLNILFCKKIGVVGIQFEKISISIVYNIGFSLLPGRICVNEDFHDLLAQVITFYIFLKSDMFEKKKEWQKTTWKFIQAHAEFMRTLPNKRAELSLGRDTHRQGVKERN